MRPTSDRVREALFSILAPRVPGARLLDLYAGTGAVGLEALSRGAAHVDFVESDPRARQVLRANLARCGAEARATLHSASVETFVRRRAGGRGPAYDLIFADPPYESEDWQAVLATIAPGELLADEGLVVVEHPRRASVPPRLGRLAQRRQYRYDDTRLTLYGLHAEGTSPQ